MGVTKSGKFRLACKVGVMKTLYSMNRISVVKNGTKELLGLEDAFKEWKGMSKISEREAARRTSNSGGQGFISAKVNATQTPAPVQNTVGFVIHTVTKEIIIALIMIKLSNLLHKVCLS